MDKCIVGHAKVTASAAHRDAWRQFPSTPLLPFLSAGTGKPVIRVHVSRLNKPSGVYYNVTYELRACIFLCMYCDDLASNY